MDGVRNFTGALPKKNRGLPSRMSRRAAKAALKQFGVRALDQRTQFARAVNNLRTELVRDLGGEAAVSRQQMVVLNAALRTHVMLESIDDWILRQQSLVNHRKRALLPVVRERTALSEHLVRCMALLGLERRLPPARRLEDVVAIEQVKHPERDDG
jgi:hypothetical protein